MFYEADTAYIGASSKGDHKQGMATDKQPFLAVLSTFQENRYPQYLKLYLVPKDTKDMMEKFLENLLSQVQNAHLILMLKHIQSSGRKN